MKKHRRKEEFGIKLPLKSGFTVLVKPLPPYYKDLIDDLIPIPDYPRRKIVLAAGDEIEWEYKPPDAPPTRDDEDYALYMKWMYIDEQRKVVEERRKRARQDFLVSNCVKILEGPIALFDSEWAHAVEAAFPGYTVPTHPGQRRLVFLKTQVITSIEEMEMIVSLCTSPEATMQGILNALQGFQSEMGEGGSAEPDKVISGQQS